jgi:photosystem II stability/assembly factor-like uncharacterized protein
MIFVRSKISFVAAFLFLACNLPAQTISNQPYVWRNVVIGGGGFVTGIVAHPAQRDLIYARTDVGGAYRWDGVAQKWIPLTDWIGQSNNNLCGIESIALDPRDANQLYLAAGEYSQGNAAILRSDDQGKTFQTTDVPFKMGGNESGRFNGERLAVDPNLGSTLFFGSRRDGLWKSADRGVTWAKVNSFPADVLARTAGGSGFGFGRRQQVGIVAVVFDPSSGSPGSATPVIFAAVSTSSNNLYASADAGTTWQPVANQPIGLRPNHIVRAAGGIFYLTYGRDPGPNTMGDGAVWKFDPKNSAWTDITPVKPKTSGQPFGYGAIAVDSRHPSTIVATTFGRWKPHDEIFRSTNGGASWKPLLEDAVWDYSFAPYTRTRTPHWMGTIVINPFNSDQILFGTGYGIWACSDATQADAGKPTHWTFLDSGLEETVPLSLISPPDGAHLVSGVGDIDGFRHDDLNASPAGGDFAGPRFGNTEDVAYAGLRPLSMVRVGAGGGPGTRTRGAISDDGGQTWRPLSLDPPVGRGAGSAALSADSMTIVWTPRRAVPYFTTDRGATWNMCQGLFNDSRVVADPVDSSQFYSLDTFNGVLLISRNGAAAFNPIPKAQKFGQRTEAQVVVTPDMEGDIWVAPHNGGLYHSTDGGTNFMKLRQIDSADSVGFGQPSPGKTFPAMYLVGTVNGLQAFFRSDDAGESWVRINDDEHQFGSIRQIIGDPRIYGRVYLATGGRGIIYGDIAATSP